MEQTHHIEIKVVIDYDTTPYRAATYWEPEEPFEVVINSVTLDGIELADSVDLEEIIVAVIDQLNRDNQE